MRERDVQIDAIAGPHMLGKIADFLRGQAEGAPADSQQSRHGLASVALDLVQQDGFAGPHGHRQLAAFDLVQRLGRQGIGRGPVLRDVPHGQAGHVQRRARRQVLGRDQPGHRGHARLRFNGLRALLYGFANGPGRGQARHAGEGISAHGPRHGQPSGQFHGAPPDAKRGSEAKRSTASTLPSPLPSTSMTSVCTPRCQVCHDAPASSYARAGRHP